MVRKKIHNCDTLLNDSALTEFQRICLTCSIGAILLLVVRTILHWIRPERAFLLLTCTAVSFFHVLKRTIHPLTLGEPDEI